MKPWFEKQLSTISSGSTLAEDIRYALNHWQGLTRFLEDGRRLWPPFYTTLRDKIGLRGLERLRLQIRAHLAQGAGANTEAALKCPAQ
ncbi:hypothetical protein J2R78_008986 [Bradyrhizobium sp. USDA 4538]|nr:hypothetical protein [Bradyrhizobium sp. USDA 4538]MCP1907414.1 hypothetical protein [Bradyrhizobium sp. USDA 4537]MCP1985200.1 hypothetical protein [Bradyrhizobium sp. USDA 4539]